MTSFNLRRSMPALCLLLCSCSSSTLSPQQRALTDSAIRANTAYVEGYPHLSANHWQEVIRKSQNLDDRKNEALGHANLATVYINTGQMELAEKHLRQAQQLTDRKLYTQAYVRNALHLTTALIHQKKLTEGEQTLKEAQQIVEEAGDVLMKASLQNAFGLLWINENKTEKACTAFDKAYQLGRSAGDVAIKAAALNNLGYCFMKTNDIQRSKEAFEEALKLDKDREYLPGVGINLLGLASLAEKEGKLDQAVTLHQRALRVNKSLGAKHLIEFSKNAIARLQGDH